MLLAKETNTGIDYFEKCSLRELQRHIKTFNRLNDKK